MKKLIYLTTILMITLLLAGCHSNKKDAVQSNGVYYEIFVRSFADSDGDGIGDLKGVTSKLDYLKDLGIKGIWLMPINPSDSYHGYDVKDYYGINSDYGTMDDFDNLVKEAHKRGIKVIMDLVINHTSKNNEWFIKSSQNDPKYKDYYTWISSDDPRKNTKSNNPTNPTNLYHKLGNRYYYGYFGDGMPDLNFSNENVKNDIYDVGKFWLDKGVDGFRLDAALHIFADYEGTNKSFIYNIYFWKEFRTKMREYNPNVYLVGEVNSDIATYAQFYEGLDSNFNFDLGRMIINAVSSNGANYANIVSREYDSIAKYDPNFIDAPFLSNHDQDRVASQITQKGMTDPQALKLAAESYLLLQGHPYIYYGEEIGMKGVKSNGPAYDETRRLPFKWGDTSTTSWFTDTFNQNLASLNQQKDDPNSLFNTYKTLIHLRNEHMALSNGKFYSYDNKNYLLQGYYRVYNEGKDKELLVIFHNFSKDTKDLPAFDGGKLVYESNGKDFYKDSKIGGLSTVIIKLPYKDLSKYIEE